MSASAVSRTRESLTGRRKNIVIEVSVGNVDADIVVVAEGVASYVIDPECRMTYATREYIAGLVVAAFKLGYSFAGDGYNAGTCEGPPELARIEHAVKLLVATLDPDELHRILGSIHARYPCVGDLVGSLEFEDWDYDSWLIRL